MTALTLVLAALLAAAVVVFVARPFLRGAAGPERTATPAPEELERLALIEERDRALAALKELEFDHRTGKVSDADYAESLPRLRQEAAAALAALDRPGEPPSAPHPAVRAPQGRA